MVHVICRKTFQEHCMPLFKKLDLLTLNDFVHLQNVKLMHKINHKIAPVPIVNLFNVADHGYNTRNQGYYILKNIM